jgi:hypothetical protein
MLPMPRTVSIGRKTPNATPSLTIRSTTACTRIRFWLQAANWGSPMCRRQPRSLAQRQQDRAQPSKGERRRAQRLTVATLN